MNGTETISKKVLPLVAVLILCAASLVTVAYAYNATYKDTVDEAGVDPTEQSKYIYITGNGLTYGEEDIPATVEVTYSSSTTFENNQPVTKLEPTFYKIAALGEPASLDEFGVATIKMGQLEINNVNTGATTVTLAVTDLTATAPSQGKTSLFEDALSADCIKFKLGDEYSSTFTFVDNKVTVDVYLVKAINLTPDKSVFSHVNGETAIDPLTIDDLDDTLQTTLVVPGFVIEIAAVETYPDKVITGTMTTMDIASAKAAASNGADVTVKVVNSAGASITMDGAAISTLGANTSALTISDVELETPIEGVSAVYDIAFGDNHFGNGTITLSVPYTLKNNESANGAFSVAYIDDNGNVGTAYAATYADGYLTFTTNHLSKYGIMEKAAGAASLKVNGLDVYYETLVDAIAAAPKDTAATVTLYEDSEGAGVFVGATDGKNLIINMNGHKYTCIGPAVGSTGTATQALHLEKDNSIIIRNGTITSTATSGVKMLVQNYCNLTLVNVTLDGSNVPGSAPYTLSNNCGVVVIEDSTIIAKDGAFAFDVCGFSSYPGVSVIVRGESIINGTIEISCDNKADHALYLKLESGTFQNLSVDSSVANAEVLDVSKADSVSITLNDGYSWAADGKLVKN